MKGRYNYLIIWAINLVFLAGSCSSNQDLDDIYKRLDALESSQIAPVDQQIESINNSISSLETVVSELSDYVNQLKSLEPSKYVDIIADLQSKDEELQTTIDGLREYVMAQDAHVQDWATATFTTLAQHNAVIQLISDVKIDISTLEEKLNLKISSDINSAFSKAELNLKSWVNSQLSGYWTISEAEAKLNALKITLEAELEEQRTYLMDQITGGYAEDFESIKNKLDQIDTISAKNKQDIAAMATELSVAREELTANYTTAINEAISTLDGKISGDISNALETANNNIDALETRLNYRFTLLEARVSSLEDSIEKIFGMIQSITVIPSYINGSVDIFPNEDSDLFFEIKPVSAASQLLKQDKGVFSLDAIYTIPRTSAEFIPITINDYSVSNDGILKLSVRGENLSSDFYCEQTNALARLYISSEGTHITSSFFPLNPRGLFAVDLGLSVKWCSINIGAKRAEDSGAYYSWGETESKDYYLWASYKWGNGSNKAITKYCNNSNYGTVDNLTTLELDDDAACAIMGERWRIPTKDEWKELIDNCTWTKATIPDSSGNNINGFRVQSESTGNYIFIPWTSYKDSMASEIYTFFCCYWSSSLASDDNSEAKVLYLQYANTGSQSIRSDTRYRGFPIRPVYDNN